MARVAKSVQQARHRAGVKAAATRAKNIAKMSTRQQKALQLQRHRAALKAARTRAANAAVGRQPRQPRKLVAAPVGYEWILGGNDDHDSCVQTAFANSLYLLTGFRVTDEAVLTLLSTGGAASLPVALRSLMAEGIGGVVPLDVVEAPYLVPGAVLGVSLPEPHTVVYDDDGLITWGGKIKHGCAVEEAYLIDWPELEKT